MGAVIILDIDELVHASQGRIGMLNDDTVLMKQNKLAELTKRLLQDGFDVSYYSRSWKHAFVQDWDD